MAKRKKNKHHAKNRKGAQGPVEAANATAAIADGPASEVDTSAEEAPATEATADIDQATLSSSVPEAEAAAVEEAAPSELASDLLETEAEAAVDIGVVVEEPKAAPVAEASETGAETGKGKRKNKKGKKAAASESAPRDTTEPTPASEDIPEIPVAPDGNSDAHPGAESEPTAEAAGAEATVNGEDGDASSEPETGDGEAAPESSGEILDAEAASADGQDAAGETSATAADDAPADGASEGDGEGQTDGASEGEASSDAPADPNALEGDRLESIIESLLFASDKALGISDLKRLLGDRDSKKITAAVQSLIQKRMDTGIQVVTLSTGWHLRTSVDNAEWVSKLLVGKPVRLSRAMMETLAIVAYRQPVTRPEVDDIRGVDCGAVLKTLLDRGLVRIIGKKEEVGRPMLYGTTQEFLRVFNLRDLTELPTLREFYDLSAEDQSKVDAEAPPTPSAITAKPDVALNAVARGALAPEEEDTDPLLDELDAASKLAKKALGEMEPEEKPEEKSDEKSDDKSDDKSNEDKPEEPSPEATANNEPESTPAGE